MAAKTVAANKAALARARERREKLDADVRAEEQRQDEATATALVALGELDEIDAVRNAKVAGVGAAVRALLDEHVSADRAAGLLGLDTKEVRRLSKVSAPAADDTSTPAGKATVTPLPDQCGSVDAARRAG